MEAKAMARHIRVSPYKARRVINLIRNKGVAEANAILKFTPNKSAEIISKVLNSAVANAEHNYNMDTTRLYVSEAYVDQGVPLKRYKPRAKGRADMIKKRSSHITVVVAEKREG